MKHEKAILERFDADQTLLRSQKMNLIKRWRKNYKCYILSLDLMEKQTCRKYGGRKNLAEKSDCKHSEQKIWGQVEI